MYKRVLLKLSGEALGESDSNSIFNASKVEEIAETIKHIHDQNVQLGIVIGAGNIWRGKIKDSIGMDQVPADFMGMLGTEINAIALSNVLKHLGVDSVVFSALSKVDDVVKEYSPLEAKKALEAGKVCFFAGGTGKPFFTTDTAAAMRAIETDCDAILMAKNGVKGVYDKDPRLNDDAKFLPNITYQEILDMNLKVMDITAVELLIKTNLKILVFSMDNKDNFIKAVKGINVGTLCAKEK